MFKPYFMEKKKIANAQWEDRRDGEEMEKFVKGGDEDGEKTEDSSEAQ